MTTVRLGSTYTGSLVWGGSRLIALVNLNAPVPPPPPETDVTPEQLTAYLAPQIDVVVGVKRDYPNLKGRDITDQVIHRLNKKHRTDRFGRKARQSNGGNPNDDVVTIRLVDTDHSKKKMIDILGNAHPGDPNAPQDVPMWGVIPASQEPGNGFWTKAVHPDRDGTAPPPPPPPPPGDESIVLLRENNQMLKSIAKHFTS